MLSNMSDKHIDRQTERQRKTDSFLTSNLIITTFKVTKFGYRISYICTFFLNLVPYLHYIRNSRKKNSKQLQRSR